MPEFEIFIEPLADDPLQLTEEQQRILGGKTDDSCAFIFRFQTLAWRYRRSWSRTSTAW